MGCSLFFITVSICLVGIVVAAYFNNKFEKEKVDAMTMEERSAYLEEKRRRQQASNATAVTLQHGPLSPQMVCPHCQVKGHIRTKAVTQKKGISGGKATAALLTAGVSVLATGLSRKEGATEAFCENCKATWHF